MKKNFNIIIKEYAETFKELKSENYDWGVMLLGLRRVGKSTLSLYIAYRIWKLLENKPKVFLFLGVIPNIHKIVKKYRIEHSIVIFDELGVGAFSRDFMKKEQKNLVKVLNVMSAYNNFYIGNIQNVYWMDKILRSTNFWKDGWLLYARGRGLWFGPPYNLLEKSSIVYLFQNWNIFEKYYEYLRPWNIKQFLDVFPAHTVSFKIRNVGNEKYINLWIGNGFKEISFWDYEKERKDLENILEVKQKGIDIGEQEEKVTVVQTIESN